MMSCENYDPCYPDQPVVDRYLQIWAQLPAFKSKPAFLWARDDHESTTWASITYSDLNSSVEAMASQLLVPLQRGNTMLILCSPGLQLVKLLFACQRAGLVAVPIIPPDPSSVCPSKQSSAHHHLLRAISQTNPTAAVAHPRYIAAVRRSSSSSSSVDQLCSHLQKLRWLSVDDLEEEAHHACGLNSNIDASEYLGCGSDETYLIQYTSGATGIPKPVLVTAGAAAHNVRAARVAYDLHPGSVIVSWLPQYHDCGLMFLLLTVVTGATCVLTSPTAFLHRPRLWLELISEFQATCTPVPSFALALVLKRGGIDHGKLPLKLGSLRNLILINEPIYKSSVDEFVNEFARVGLKPSSISPSYGLAENCTFVSTAWHCTGGDSSSFSDVPSYNKLLPSAKLASYGGNEEIEVVVVDGETCEPVEDGVEGEIWVSSPSNASGYLGHPSMTREVFHARLRGRASRCFMRTGDIGVVIGEERYLYVLGRALDVITMGDRLVHPHYLEAAAYDSSPENLRGGCIAAFGVDSPRSPMSVMVVVVAELQKGGSGIGIGAHRSICERIRAAILKQEGVKVGMVALVGCGSVPKTTSGKLRRWMAKNELLCRRLPVVYEVRFDDALLENGKGVEWEKEGVVRVDRGEVGSEVPVLVSSAGRRPSVLSFL